tara:strand:- start:54 stop:194 length:141 start_codon:yes stop_codon:yes gene_type:complete
MNNDDEKKLKVCGNCDAPLPYFPEELNFFKNNNKICDDCLKLKNEN